MSSLLRLMAVLFFLCFISEATRAQSADSVLLVDDIQFDLKEYHIDENNKELVINLFAISYNRDPREFKMNTFSTQVIDQKKQALFFSSIQMGNVLIKFDDRQNYLHYLLEEDRPVDIQVVVKNWRKTDRPAHLKLVFESSEEEGKFLEVPILLAK